MPRVPLFNNGETVKSVAPSSVPSLSPGGNSSLRVSLAGAQSAAQGAASTAVRVIEEGARAGQQPTKPYSLADNSGDQAIAAAMQQAGEVLGVIYQKEQQAREVKAHAEAELAMAEAQGQYWADRENDTDFDSYPDKWAATVDGVRAKVLENSGLHGRAKERLNQSLSLWAIRGGTRAQSAKTTGILGETRKSIVLNIDRAADAGDSAGVVKWVGEGVQLGVLSQADGEAKIYEKGRQIRGLKRDEADNLANSYLNDPASRDVAKAREVYEKSEFFRPDEKAAKIAEVNGKFESFREQDEVNALVLNDPAAAKERLEAGDWPRISAGAREKLKLRAGKVQAAFAMDIFQDVQTRIDLGQVKQGETFEAEPFKQLTPLMRDLLKQRLSEYGSKSTVNDSVNYQKAVTAVENYNPADDADGMKRAELETVIGSRFTLGYEAELRRRLDEKFKEPDATRVPLSDAFAALDKWAFDDRRFGEYEEPVFVDGKPVGKMVKKTVQAPGLLYGTNNKEVEAFQQDKRVNPVKRDAITRQVQSVKQQLENEVKAGKITTREEAMKRLSELTRIPVAQSAAAEAVGEAATFNPLLPPLPSGQQPTAEANLKRLLDLYAPNP